MSAADKDDLSVGAYRRIDEACGHFEKAWRAGARPRIEDYLPPGPSAERRELLRELVALERELSEAAGERLDGTAYEQRFPGERDIIRTVFTSRPATVPGQTGGPDPARTLPPGASAAPLVGPARSWRAVGYEIVRELGRGGMGIVYEARQVRLNRTVALKTVLSNVAASPRALVRFLAEAEHVAQLRHPNIVRVYDVGKHEGRPYIAFEYIDGETLASHLRKQRLSPRDAAALVEQIARAVGHAHQQGIVHRDLKPANILLDRQGRPHITDFGLARQTQSGVGLTATGEVLGTPAYMAPEQARGEARHAGPPADIHALGVLLYECLAGKPPFTGAAMEVVLHKVAHEPPLPLAGAPPELEAICLRCLEKSPHKRYPTADALADDLRRFLDRDVRPALSSLPPTPTSAPVNRPLVMLLAAVAPLALFGLALALWQWSVTRDEGREALAEAEAVAEQRLADAWTTAARREARLAVELGTSLCAQGDTRSGRTWLAHALKLTTDGGDAELSRVARTNLAAWEAPNRTIGPAMRHDSAVLAVAVHEDEFLTVSGRSLFRWGPQGQLRDRRPLDGLNRPLRAAAFRPDGELVAGATENGPRFWRLDGPAWGGTSEGPAVANLAFSGDGKELLTLPVKLDEPDGPGRWALTDMGAQARPWTDRPRGATCGAFTPGGELLLIGCRDRDVRLYARDGQSVGTWRHESPVTAVTAGAAGLAATACEDGTVMLWNLTTRQPIGPPLRRHGPVTALAFDPAGAFLVSASADRAYIWDTRTRLLLGPVLRHPAPIRAVAVHGREMLTGGDDGTAQRWLAPRDRREGDASDIGRQVRQQTGLEVGADGQLRRVE